MIYTSAARATELGASKNLPFVHWLNLAKAATLGGTATLTDGAVSNAVDGNTADYWLPNVTTTSVNFQVTFAAPTVVSFVGIAAHNISDFGAAVQVQRSVDGGSTWLSAGLSAQTPTDNSTIGIRLIENVSAAAADWRVRITSLTAGDDLYIGNISMGGETIFPIGFYADYSPIISPTEVQPQSNVSVGGNLLGSSIIRQGSTLDASLSYMPAAWVRTNLKAFIAAFNEVQPFYFAWRPETFPDDVHFCWRNSGAIRPANMGVLDFMTMKIGAQVFEP